MIKRGVKKGHLRSEEAEGHVWHCGRYTCVFMFSTQYPANIMLGYRALFCVNSLKLLNALSLGEGFPLFLMLRC